MEFLRTIKRKSFLSEFTYKVLNICLAIAVLLIIRSTGSPLPAILLILLSKWRVFAVRPRYWFANIQTNLVDFIVSVSFVVFLYDITAGDPTKLVVQSVLTLLYIVWLVFIKPKSRRLFVLIQAGTALFCGVTALFSVSYNWPASLVVIFMWLIGYTTARHVLSSYDEQYMSFLSLVWGLVLAELGWLAYHWTIAYDLLVVDGAKLPQISFVASCLAFLAYKVYDSYNHHQKIRTVDVVLPLLFSVSVILVLLLFFNKVSSGSI